ncbi:hypothetical protein CQS04_12095 [Chryseomicrobium excrementi]|uniref:GGDEF domain-containing protein n=2 Tax=Chryseomicrobium excrementi TaxID=2041346 RepID=A0A2M9EXQ3_9BACL|nr:hypothetical protein CQS04_12095 [Chryseomicrobium excrementi]
MKLPLKFWIIFITTLTMVITLTVIFVTEYYVSRETLTETALEQNYSNARKLSALTNDSFIMMQDTLHAHHDKILENWDDPQMLKEIVQDVHDSNFNFNSVTIINADGTGRANHPELNLVGKFVNSDGVKTGIELQEDFISEPYIGTNDKLMLIVSTALYQNGEYYGMLNGLVWLQEQNFLTRLLEQTYGSDVEQAAVYDRNGNYIYHRNSAWIGTKAHENQATRDLAKGLSGKGIIENRLGETFYAGYTRVPESGWGIISMTPEELALAPASLSANRALLIGLPFIIGAFLLLIGLILFITRPLNRLSAVDYSKPIGEIIGEAKSIQSPYREAENIKQMILSFAQNQQHLVTELETLAVTDPMTGLANRRQFNHMVTMIKENNEIFGFIILDIDRFKSINDTYGHLIGDQVIIKLADILKSFAPTASLPVRLGGEEFGFVLQDTSMEGVYALAERIRREVEHAVFPVPQAVTVSIGAGYLDCDHCDLNTFFNAVDEQLYKAKEGGRNRVETVSFIKGIRQNS